MTEDCNKQVEVMVGNIRYQNVTGISGVSVDAQGRLISANGTTYA